MSGEIPKFLDGEPLPDGYFAEPNPYTFLPNRDVNLLEISRYARRVGKKITEMTKEEVEQFKKNS